MHFTRSMTHFAKLLATSLALLVLTACSTIDTGAAPALDSSANWVVLPFANHTETPLAGNRAEAIAMALLHNKVGKAGKVQRYVPSTQQEALFDTGDAKRQQDALSWAREQQARYALAGAVDEWRYKVGVDGEPAVGLSLQILDVASGDILWTGTGGKSGWSREALSAVAQKLTRELLNSGVSSAR